MPGAVQPTTVSQEAPQTLDSVVSLSEKLEEASPLEQDFQLEQKLEQEEEKEEFLENEPTIVAASAPSDSTATATAPPVVQAAPVQPKDEITIEVEKILEDGLGDFVATMPDEAKVRFRAKGEEIAVSIASMVRQYKVRVKEVVHAIRNWLLTIPGVNKFFLEQEAKIKTDRILDLEETYHKPPSSK